MFSSDARKLTNSGNARSMGIGGQCEKYAGLFAEQGGFDAPAAYSAGVKVMPVQGLSISADVERIEYSKVKAIGSPMPPNLMTARLGTDGGAEAFRWGRRRCPGAKRCSTCWRRGRRRSG